MAVVPATGAPCRNVFVLADRARTARAGVMRIRGQRDCAVLTEIVARFGDEVATPGADGRVDELSQSARDVEEHGVLFEGCGELAYAARRLFSRCVDENIDWPFRLLHKALRRHEVRVL